MSWKHPQAMLARVSVRLEPADFAEPALSRFVQAHLDELAPTAPSESRHALALADLQRPGVRLWVARAGSAIVGTGALAPLEGGHEELKSMRTNPTLRGQGIGTRILVHLLADARRRRIDRISLETGSMDFFAPARALYAKFGFVACAPFGTYTLDPNSSFMTLRLATSPAEAGADGAMLR
jgi:putative acetyltransferase